MLLKCAAVQCYVLCHLKCATVLCGVACKVCCSTVLQCSAAPVSGAVLCGVLVSWVGAEFSWCLLVVIKCGWEGGCKCKARTDAASNSMAGNTA